MADKDDLKDDLEAFKRSAEAESEQRREALDMLKFVKLGEQWPSDVKSQRELEGRPCLVINRLPAFGKQVTNDARQNRPMIKTHPVGDKADRETAEILNGLIRNIEYTSNADVAYDTALDFAVNCGIGYTMVNIDYANADNFDKDIKIERVDNPFAIYGDPDSKAADSSDWNRAFVISKMTKDDFERKWPDAKSEGFDKTDANSGWFEDDRIQVAESWSRFLVPSTLIKLSDGSIMAEPEFLKLKDILDVQGVTVLGTRQTQLHKVVQRIITGVEVLETNDWAGRYIPIVPCYGDEVNVDGKRSFQSLFHFAKDAQRNYNYHRSMITELGALAPKTPFIGPIDAFQTDIDKWNTANNQAHSFIGYDGPIAPQRQGFAGPPPGVMQEALAASDDMKTIMGLYDASLGARSNETSGRAILARQREGDVSTFNFIDNQARMIRHLGVILVDLIPKVYNVPRIVRVIKEDGTNYSVPVNQPVQVIQAPPQPGKPNIPQYQPVPQGGMPQGMPQGPMPPQMSDDQRNEMAGLIKTFDLAAGKYDVTCESGPSFTTRREEAAAQMMQFVQAFPQAAPVIGDLIAKSLDWPGADDIAKRLQSMLPPQAQDGAKPPQLMQAEQAIQQLQQQIQQMGGQLQQASQQLNDKQGDMQIKQGELQLKAQEMQLKARELELKAQDSQVKMVDAETKRMQAQMVTPETPTDNSFEAWKLEMQTKFDTWKTQQDNATKLKIAMLQSNTTVNTTQQKVDQKVNQQVGDVMQSVMPMIADMGEGLMGMGEMLGESIGDDDNAQSLMFPDDSPQHEGAEGEVEESEEPEEPKEEKPDPLMTLVQMHAELMAHLTKPKTIIRDANGRAQGIQ